jgi:AS-48H
MEKSFMTNSVHFFKHALRILTINKRRAILTMLGIIIGLSCIVIILSVGEGLQLHALKKMSNNQDTNKVSIQLSFQKRNNSVNGTEIFSEDDKLLIKSIEGVSDVEINQLSSSFVTENIIFNGKSKVVGINLVESTFNNAYAGEGLTLLDSEFLNKKILISTDLADEFTYNVRDLIGKEVVISNEVYTISGIFDNKTDLNLYEIDILIPKRTYEFVHKTNNQTFINILVNKEVNLKKISSEILDIMARYGSNRNEGKYEILNLDSLIKGLGTVFSSLTIFISMIAGISLLIAGVGVMNMMYSSVSERAYEVGIRRAIGATRKDILIQFLFEGIILTATAGIIGYFLGIAMSQIIGFLLPFYVPISAKGMVISIVIIIVVGILSSIGPARYISKKNIIDLLRN